jgi:hypothetical protein
MNKIKQKQIFKNCMINGKYGEGHNKNALCLTFCCVNDGKDVVRGNFQIMKCIFWYNNILNPHNPKLIIKWYNSTL